MSGDAIRAGGVETYHPDDFMRDVVTKDDESSTGVNPERHAVATLRVFTGKEAEWLLYGGIQGGRQGEGWIELYYRGLVTHEGELTFGDWLVRLTGEGLEPVAQQLGRQIRTMLKVGSTTFNQQPVKVAKIEITPLKFKVQEGMQ